MNYPLCLDDTQTHHLHISIFEYISLQIRQQSSNVAELSIINVHLACGTGVHVCDFPLLGRKRFGTEDTLELGVRTARASLDRIINNQELE